MPRRSRSSDNNTSATRPKRSRRSSSGVESRAGRDRELGGGDGRRINISDADFHDHNAALRAIERQKASDLHPVSLEYHIKENRKAHHTDEYEHESLIVRRGQAFKLEVGFDRPFNKENDSILLQFTTGKRPQESKGSVRRVAVTYDASTSADKWQASVTGQEENNVTITVSPSCEAIVGRYSVYVETVSVGDGEKFTSRQPFDSEEFIILFNPWSTDDQVYLGEEEEREEYVLKESGRLYQGSARMVSSMAWNFGQFEDVCLDAALYLMDKGELAVTARSNPVHVVRCLSAMSNCSDEDGGVLTGRWTDEFPKDCTLPWAWTGSVAILEEFMATKKAVRFGQCWVFSGIVTTLLRALGIATRSVTNFESAHDCDGSVTIDYHWSADEDKPMTDYNDSIWNFHVWNESWFARRDLPDGYDGWQAHDATPQEASEGIMRCGPASLKAIKEGNVYLPYDAPFIFAEVNGDKVHWAVKEDGSMEVIGKEIYAVGRKISTKAVGSNARNDITNNYKFGEGTDDERCSVRRAFRYCSSRAEHEVYDIPEADVKFHLDTPEQLQLGHDFAFTVHLTNTTSEVRNVSCRVSAMAAYYTGVPSDEITAQVFTKELQPDAEASLSLPVSYSDVEGLLKPDDVVTVYLKGTVKETKRSYAHVESFNITKPALKVEVDPARVKIGEEFDVTISVTNPLISPIKGGEFLIEAAGIVKSLRVPYSKKIGPGETVNHTVRLTARRSGNKEILVNFSSKQLAGLSGVGEVYITYGY